MQRWKPSKRKFGEAAVESFWSVNGEVIYVLKDGADLVEYGDIVKYILETNGALTIRTTSSSRH